jgi:hypothetical protein
MPCSTSTRAPEYSIRATSYRGALRDQKGIVYEKNLGKDTAGMAKAMTEFYPDAQQNQQLLTYGILAKGLPYSFRKMLRRVL